MKKSVSRRSFLKSAAAGVTAPLILPKLSFAAPANSKLQHAAIGVAGQGAYDLGNIVSCDKVDVVALCDIDAINLDRASKQYPNARLYRDWREMLAQEADKLDSVNVSTPDHTHAPATMSAIRKGLHVFCEKPLTHDVYEARKVTLAARKAGVATQMGNQIHSHKFYRTGVQWMKEGAIGKIKEWHSWSGAIFTNESKQRPAGSDPVPDHVDWDLWLGTAPVRPYIKDEYHKFWWRRWRDFGGGAVGDFGCHIFDTVFTALNIKDPITISAKAESISDEVWPAWTRAYYEFPGNEMTAGKTIRATWKDGGKKPATYVSPHVPDDFQLPGSGSLIIGEEGTLLIPHVGPPKLFPLEKFKNYPQPELEDINHYHQFVDAAMGKCIAGSHFDFAGPMTEAVLLANVAGRFPQQKLEWDAKRMKIKNCKEANKYLRRKYRKGWEVRGL